MTNKIYDFVIIGSGIGGLECAYILASEGYSVIVLEKNHQIGGNLQVFSRDKCIFDTGVHYIGSMDEKETLWQFFTYFDLIDNLKWKRLDDDCFDLISFSDGTSYKLGQGYNNFKRNLKNDFPDEHQAIDAYCNKIQEICKKFPLYNLENTGLQNHLLDEELLTLNTAEYISSITTNTKLQNVLAGNNSLYAGVKEKSPFYVHALITNSYIQGAYRLVDGGSQIAIQLAKSIRKYGGEIHKRKEVTGANYDENGHITEVLLKDGTTVKGKTFISNMHPQVTIDIFGKNHFVKAYRNRIKKIENTESAFIVHLVLKKNTFKYLNYNIYHHFCEDVWDGFNYTNDDWPKNIYVSIPATSKSNEFADSMTVMSYMKFNEVEKWKNTFNTVANPGKRGEDYEQFKQQKAQKVIERLEEIFPGIKSKIKAVYSSSPLTYRDYIGDETGSLYGILKDSNNPLKTLINSKTKVPNLYLTGQNLILHGILGTTIGAFVTCFNFVDKDKLLNKVMSK